MKHNAKTKTKRLHYLNIIVKNKWQGVTECEHLAHQCNTNKNHLKEGRNISKQKKKTLQNSIQQIINYKENAKYIDNPFDETQIKRWYVSPIAVPTLYTIHRKECLIKKI